MKKLLAVLGLQTFTFQSNFWGGGKAHVKLDEEQLKLIEAALDEKGSGEEAQTIADLQEKVAGLEAAQEALTAAMNLNGIEAKEGQAMADAIADLGAKCKEYGDSKETHSAPPTNGKDKGDDSGLIEGFMDPNAEHNQLLTKLLS